MEGSKPTYQYTRFLILRLLGFVYFFAFLSLALQVVPLVGQDGLLPANTFLEAVRAQAGSRLGAFLELPGFFWLGLSDRLLVVMAWTGAALSLAVLLGCANALLMAALWMLYMSFVHVGQDWYGYGWEIQLLETGFLAIFLCPLLDGRPFPKTPPPPVVIRLFRWLAFRIMLGAGLIKLRGDPCWRDLTCLYYHYETQPIPNPLSPYFHFAPHWFLKIEALWNHFIELVVPWVAFGPRKARPIAGALLASFQVVLILSGNLSFLNYLTIVPILACFDDSLFPQRLPDPEPSKLHENIAVGLAVVIAALSIAPTMNLLSGAQLMNASFDPLHLVNTYGAFGSVGRERREIVFEGSDDREHWKEYEFPCKPGDPFRHPCFVSPYQPRLDWQIWFAAMSTPDQYPWTFHFIWKLLYNDPGTLRLLAKNPFPQKPPRYIRAELYHYWFAPLGNLEGAWWKRERLGDWLPPLSAEDPDFRQLLDANGWK